MKVDKEFLLMMTYGDCPDGWEVLDDEVTGSGRWSEYHTMVFTILGDDKIYSVDYSCGLTENQDERPFEYEPDMVEVHEVKAVSKTIVVYERV